MADLTTIKKQIIALLDVPVFSAGTKTYSSTSGDENVLDEEIERAITEAQYVAAERVCIDDNSTLKTAFLQLDQAILHEAALPNHFGRIANVKITPFAGANPITGEKRTAQQINDFRENSDSIYGQTAHNAQDTAYAGTVRSPLAGFYAVENGIFYFTGESATITYADYTGVALADYPVSLEPPITHIAIGLLAKDGSVSEKFAEHLQIGMSMLGTTIAEKE